MNKSKYGKKYTYEILSEAVANSESVMGVLRYIGVPCAGGTHAHVSRKIKDFKIDTSHFTGARWNKGKSFPCLQKTAEEILVVLPEGSKRPRHAQLKRAMLQQGLTYQCQCGIIDEWQGKPISLEIDHIDGNWLNNKLDNLRFICPNCHSQETDTNMPHKYRTT